jgi:enoyl-CoA hydratase/carnithine racemase
LAAAQHTQIAYEVTDGVATITLDRPERLNAFTNVMAAELLDAFDDADADDEVRVVVVTGRGRAFCAGADLRAGGATFDPSAGEGLGAVADDGRFRDIGGMVAVRIYRMLKPVIAAVNGPAMGVAANMILPMDIRLAAEGARFGYVFTRRGIAPASASSWFLPRVVGMSRAAEWLLAGRTVSAAEALEAGLVRSVHAEGELLAAAHELAREIADNTSAVSVALTRQLLWQMAGEGHPMTAHRVDSRVLEAMGRSDDASEGIAAFTERRPAVFPMRVSTDLPDVFPWSPPPDF